MLKHPPLFFRSGASFGQRGNLRQWNGECAARKLTNCGWQELPVAIAEVKLLRWLDAPDSGNAHLFVVRQLLQGAGHGVFGRENLKDGQRRMGHDLFAGGIAAEQDDIGNTNSSRCNQCSQG